jgi:hypothetical protein
MSGVKVHRIDGLLPFYCGQLGFDDREKIIESSGP